MPSVFFSCFAHVFFEFELLTMSEIAQLVQTPLTLGARSDHRGCCPYNHTTPLYAWSCPLTPCLLVPVQSLVAGRFDKAPRGARDRLSTFVRHPNSSGTLLNPPAHSGAILM